MEIDQSTLDITILARNIHPQFHQEWSRRDSASSSLNPSMPQDDDYSDSSMASFIDDSDAPPFCHVPSLHLASSETSTP